VTSARGLHPRQPLSAARRMCGAGGVCAPGSVGSRGCWQACPPAAPFTGRSSAAHVLSSIGGSPAAQQLPLTASLQYAQTPGRLPAARFGGACVESGRRQQIGGALRRTCASQRQPCFWGSACSRASQPPLRRRRAVFCRSWQAGRVLSVCSTSRMQLGSCAQAVCVSAKRKAAAADSDACIRGWLLLISPYTVIDRNRRSIA